MKKTTIYILVDYLNRFETKVPAIPYRSGFDKNVLKKEFIRLGYSPIFINYAEIDFKKFDFKNKFVIYTSIEDPGLFYKDFIEDILWGIKLQGGILIPRLELFRAHHNKVFMEILRVINNIDYNITSRFFGSYKELQANIDNMKFPVVIKSASGSGSNGVKLANNKKELIRYCKKLSNAKTWKDFFKEKALLIKRFYQTKHFFKTESLFRKKFIIQNYIPDLTNDWKVLVYGEKYYILKRDVRKNDFRASGSGNFTSANNTNLEIPEGFFDFVKDVYDKIKCPNLSLDVAYNNGEFFLIEFQAISFGTLTQTISNSYFLFQNNKISKIREKISLEKVYAESIDRFIRNNYE